MGIGFNRGFINTNDMVVKIKAAHNRDDVKDSQKYIRHKP
jgi:hypothetical protein